MARIRDNLNLREKHEANWREIDEMLQQLAETSYFDSKFK